MGQSETCLSLTNTAPSLSGKIEAGFWVILLCGPRLLFGHPYYEPLLCFMIYIYRDTVHLFRELAMVKTNLIALEFKVNPYK